MAIRVAVIGAGMAGLSSACRLRESGINVVVFEKSCGLGGRMATRRTHFGMFDHGAQYFTARDADFRMLVDRLCGSGHAAPWFSESFAGRPAMNAPAKFLSEGLDVVSGCEVTGLVREHRGWRLAAKGEAAASPRAEHFDAVVLAIPAPQAATLVASAGAHPDGLSNIRMAPCWALMAAFEHPCRWGDAHENLDHPAIAWISDNSRKPGRSAATANLTVHATAQWSRDNLELSNDEARDQMLRILENAVGGIARPIFAVAHRWRYALVEQPAGTPFLWDANLRLGACGDWCLGPRVECAFQSGNALGRFVSGFLGELNEH